METGTFFGQGRSKFYPWKEPAHGTDVLETRQQPSHMDVRDGAGGSIVIAIDKAQSIDIVPDSAYGIELL